MKNLLFAILLISGSAFSQTGHGLLDPGIRLSTYQNYDDSARKIYKDSTGEYKILYVYDSRIYMEPATWPPGDPHYNATITVFKKDYKKWIQLGPSFEGTYVKNGCFEDVPADQVAKAKKNYPGPGLIRDNDGNLWMDTLAGPGTWGSLDTTKALTFFNTTKIFGLGNSSTDSIFVFQNRSDTSRCIFLASDTTATYRGKMKIEDHLVFWMFGYVVQHLGTTRDAPIYLDPEKKPVTYFIWDVKYIK
jgi:hypothetical protein